MRDQYDKDPAFADWVRLLRYWLAMRNVPDREKIRIEVIFPDAQSQHYALASLKQELTPAVMATSGVGFDPIGAPIEFEGVKISFTNPQRWDRRVA